MPIPQEDESRDDFVSRCIPIVLADEAADDQDQAVAICNSMWEEASKEQDKMTDTMEHKTFSSFVTKADEDQGIIEAVFAVFGNIDQGNDIIHPGAFTKTFAERGGKVRVLDNHRTDTVMRAIGKPLMFKEVSREELPPQLLAQHPEAIGGAFASVQMLMDTPEGKGAFIRLKEGAIDEWSFGYDALDVEFSQAMQDGKEINVRNLRTLKLFEISPVLFGMNEATTTVSAKASDDDEKTVSGATNLPIVKQAGPDDDSIVAPWNKAIEFGDGRYMITSESPMTGAQAHRLTEALKSWWEDKNDKFFVIGFPVTIAEVREAPVIPQVATDNQNDKQAGPEPQVGEAPPTSSVLDEIALLELEIELLEASYV